MVPADDVMRSTCPAKVAVIPTTMIAAISQQSDPLLFRTRRLSNHATAQLVVVSLVYTYPLPKV